MFSNSNQSITTAFGNTEQIIMDGRMESNGLTIDNSRITVNNTGIYEVFISLNPNISLSFLTTFMLRVNGASVYNTARDLSLSGQNNIIISLFLQLSAGDIVDLAASAPVIGVFTIPSGNVHLLLKQLS